MKCESCNENDITYNKNCYKEYNSNDKTFYKPESTTEITSCYELLNYYIEENTYECVSSIPIAGYFLANSDNPVPSSIAAAITASRFFAFAGNLFHSKNDPRKYSSAQNHNPREIGGVF